MNATEFHPSIQQVNPNTPWNVILNSSSVGIHSFRFHNSRQLNLSGNQSLTKRTGNGIHNKLFGEFELIYIDGSEICAQDLSHTYQSLYESFGN